MAGFDIKKFKKEQLEALKRLQSNSNNVPVFDSKIELNSSIFEDTIQNITESNNPLFNSLNEQLQNAGYKTEDILTILDSNQDGKIASEEIEYLSNIDGDNKLTSVDFEKFIQEATSKETQEAILNLEADNLAIEELTQIARQYTLREDLTPEEYCQIIAINQMETVFKNTYSKYTEQLDSEGFIDDVWNSLKDLTGLGITREMVECEFNSHFNTTKALSAFINKDYETSSEILKEEFIRKINEESEGNVVQQFYSFIEYYQDENIAIEKFNEFMANAQQQSLNTPEVVISKDKDNNYYIKVGANEPEKFSDIEGIETNPFITFNYKLNNETITNENFYDTKISDDFNLMYEFFTGAEYNPEYIEDYIQKNYMYSSANMGYYSAYQIQETLSEKPLEDVFSEFLNLNNGDTESAIEQFNTYYDSILNSEDSKDLISRSIYSEGNIKGLNARLNENGEIEYVISIEPDENGYMLSSLGEYTENNGLREYIYNPAEIERLYESGDNYAYMQYVDKSNVFEAMIFQINRDVKSNNILCNRFEKSFEETNGLTLEEISQQYFESYKKALGDSDLQNILNDYINDMDTYASKLSAIISIGSIGLSFICPAFGIGALVGAGIDNLSDGINMLTNSKKESAEEWTKLFTDTISEATMIAIGMGIGKNASQLGAKAKELLLNRGMSLKSASILGIGIETVTDVGLSVGADYLTTGNFNLKGNSLAGFIDIMSGIRGYKAIASLYSESYTPKADEVLKGVVLDDIEPQKLIETQTPDDYVETTFTEGDRVLNSDIAETVSTAYSKNTIYVEPPKLLEGDISIPASRLSEYTRMTDIDAETLRIDNPYEYYATKTYNEAIDKAIAKGEPVSSTRLSAAQEIITKGEAYQQIDRLAGELVAEHKSGTYTIDTLREIAESLGYTIEGDIPINKNEAYVAEAGTITITARAKGKSSTLSKLKNKVLELKTDLPETIADARALVGDSQGVRIIVESGKITPETISKLEIDGLEKQDTEFLSKYLEGDLTSVPKEKIQYYQSIENEVLNGLAEIQAQEFVDNLCRSIANGEIVISEINNYSGPNGIPYLSAAQVEKIQKTYAKWYQDIYELTETNPKDSQYEIRVDDKGNSYLFDTISQTKFIKEIPTKSATITTNNAGIKKSGYTGAQFNVVNSYGQQTELQYRGTVLNHTAETEHIIYDIMSDKETVSEPIYDDLKNAINKMKQIDKSQGSTKLIDEFQRYYNDIYIASRKQELGIDIELPDLRDYPSLTSNLTEQELYIISLDGVLDLHARVEEMKNANKQQQ